MDDLTPDQRRELRRHLEVLRDRLERALEATVDDARPVAVDLPIGRVSRADALQQQSLARASRHSNRVRLAQVNAALAAFGDGAYGDCRECGDPIGYRRLRARPETPFCLACQGRRESGR